MLAIDVRRYPPRYGAAPRLRALDVEEVHAQGQRLFGLRKQGAKGDEPLLVTQEALVLAGFFDGTRDLRGVQKAVHAQYGQLLYCEKIHELALLLHRHGLFEGKPPARRGVRPARHAGRSYEADPARLQGALEALFRHPEGPGAPGPWSSGARVAGVLVPAVEDARGGAIASHAWKALVEGSDAELFVLLGAAPETSATPLLVSRRDYETPLGRMPTDQAAADKLEEALGAALFSDDAAFDVDRAIELAAVRLRHVAGDRPVSILPVLVGPYADSERLAPLLARAVEGRKVAFVASTSLAHLGPTFGDFAAPSAGELDAVRLKDLSSIERLARADVAGFLAQVEADPYDRHLLGAGALGLLLRATGGRLRLLRYEQAARSEDGSTITFAAATVEHPA